MEQRYGTCAKASLNAEICFLGLIPSIRDAMNALSGNIVKASEAAKYSQALEYDINDCRYTTATNCKLQGKTYFETMETCIKNKIRH